MTPAFHRFALALLVSTVVTTSTARSAEPSAKAVISDPKVAALDPDFQLQGEYTRPGQGVQVIALGEGEFEVVAYRGGLPGAGWDGSERQRFEEDAAGVRELIEPFTKVDRKSPTLGLQPPPGAVVLFDGTAESAEAHWQPAAKITDDGLLIPAATSEEVFTDFSLHIEFRTPFMPHARGQARGNSGVYYQGRYETQVLDSFGLEGKDNECGGIYGIKPPDVNMCLRPLSWQTYDVQFRAARFNESGEKIANARITVRHNGVVIHNNVEIPRTTTAAPQPEENSPGPIHLQDHGNPVRYRNIWVLPLSGDVTVTHPLIPGFERFYGTTQADAVDAGEFLIGELNCTACHAASDALQPHLVPRTAPVLTDIGRRALPEYLYRFISDPHETRPGTLMPDLFVDVAPDVRSEQAEALVHFLMGTGSPKQARMDRQAEARGRTLYHTIGCVACHQPLDGTAVSPLTSVPLTGLEEKYTIPGLAEFLRNPHAARPSGRMPNFKLDEKEAADLAAFLLRDGVEDLAPNLQYAAYHGSWEMLPNFAEHEPIDSGVTSGFDLTVAGRESNFGIRFEGVLKIEKDGRYKFHLGSDDGSRLFIDGNLIIDNDGVHPHVVKSEPLALDAGEYPLMVDYAQVGGEWTLSLEYEGPGIPRQPVENSLQLPEGVTAPQPAVEVVEEPSPADAIEIPNFDTVDPEKAAAGRELFVSIGCANCHELRMPKDAAPLEPLHHGRPLALLSPQSGCLSDSEKSVNRESAESAGQLRIARFEVSTPQRAAISAALTAPERTAPPTPAESLHRRLVALNCYACHSRDRIGGPEQERKLLFATTIPEMGDEGRIPPPLDGVGDKLKADWLRHVLQNGANDRPYMLTRMPQFGTEHVQQIAAALQTIDRRATADSNAKSLPKVDEPEHRVISTGRLLVGDQGLSCVKCHSFGKYPGTGIQAINLQTMARRLNEDWFHRYMLNPQKYRPGTRMPTSFPGGVSAARDIYDGEPGLQLAAMWKYLSEGDEAGIPSGILADPIELIPRDRPIIYRNFIEGLTPRGIAVGYPEHANLAFDANLLAIRLLWHGAFIDASQHWTGRGAGFQQPLGIHVIEFEPVLPFAELDDIDAVWSEGELPPEDWRFRGYRLDEERRPVFRYGNPRWLIEDYPIPVAKTDEEGNFVRRLKVTRLDRSSADSQLFFRVAVGRSIEEQGEGWYLINGALRVRIDGESQPELVTIAERQELRLPITANTAEFRQSIEW